MPKVYINGKECEAKDGKNMLEAAIDAGFDLPYFCWHPAMGSVGSCRLCAVKIFKDENDTKGSIQMACMTPVRDGIRMSINDPEAEEFRRYVIELLMINHPHDCPVCDEGGECHLQDMTAMCDQVYRKYRGKKRTFYNQDLGPFINHEMNRCIQCYRCVRFYKEHAGGKDLNVFGSRDRLYFGRAEDGKLESEFSGNLVEVCPTGVFTDKTAVKKYTRKWDLDSAPGVCMHCSLGCNVIPGARYGEMRRVRSRFSSDVNGYFICDRGRFGYGYANSPSRLQSDRMDGKDTSLENAIARVKEAIRDAKGVVGIGSPRTSIENNFALKRLVGDENYSCGIAQTEHSSVQTAIDALQNGPARTPSLAEIERADVVLVVSSDLTCEAPMMDFAVRQAMRKAPLDIAKQMSICNWDAKSVANALQDAKGKLHFISPSDQKLHEIAKSVTKAGIDETVAYATEIENLIRGDNAERPGAKEIAEDLKGARQPVVIASTTCGEDIVRAAANIAWALCDTGKDCWLSYIFSEANTVGSALVGGMEVETAIEKIISGSVDTLVICENDLTRRVDKKTIEKLRTSAKTIIVLDYLDTETVKTADIVLPTACVYESNGTLVNSEARAQTYYQVHTGLDRNEPAWKYASQIADNYDWTRFTDVLEEASRKVQAFAKIGPKTHENKIGIKGKIARESFRYSGRTAMNAHKTMFEPRPKTDDDTPFTFSMEGEYQDVPGGLAPIYWSPGWNSTSAINKFQIEVGGPMHGGHQGTRLIEPKKKTSEPYKIETKKGSKSVYLLSVPAFMGSEELTGYVDEIAGLAPREEIRMNAATAAKLGEKDGEESRLISGGIRVKIDESVAENTAIVPGGLEHTKHISSITHIYSGDGN